MPSEIKRLLEQIDTEQQAMRQGLTGLASVARHDFIQKKQAIIDQAHQRLHELLGDAATQFVADIIDSVNILCDCQEACD